MKNNTKRFYAVLVLFILFIVCYVSMEIADKITNMVLSIVGILIVSISLAITFCGREC